MEPLIFPYTAVQLTGQVNRIPNSFGLLNDLNLFPSAGSVSTLVEVRRENGIISVLSAKERGAPADVADRKRGDVRYFEIPHFPFEDRIEPRDLQNMLEVTGTSAHPRTLDEEIAKRLLGIRMRHAITLEWVRVGALQGSITDGDGNVIYNLFDSFSIQPNTIDFDLGNASADIQGKCALLIETVANNLMGEVMSRVEVLVSSAFFNAFVQHPKVEKFFLNWQAAASLSNQARANRGGQLGREFLFEQILFREYYGYAPVRVNGVKTTVPFVPGFTGSAYPAGTMDTFKTHFAPADDLRFVNTPGEEVYISPRILDHGKGVEFLTESNPLAICRRPETLVQITSASSGAAPALPMPQP